MGILERALSGARALVTGASGFVGTHLRECLLADNVEVCTMDRTHLGRTEWIAETLRQLRPTHIFHLAGVLPEAPGGEAVQYEANLMSTVRVLEAVLASELDPWVMVASSSAIYGDTTPAENPLREDRPLRPLSHYAVSKVAQEMAALRYHLAHHLRTVRVRTFNLVGPGQPAHLVLSDLARQATRAEWEGGPLRVRVGNLFPRRDYTDVRDAVRAYLLLAEGSEAGGVYNVCVGRSTSVQECVDLLADVMKRPLRVERDEARIREMEIPDQVGDPRRLRQATGWEPRISFEESVRDLLEYWRERVRNERGIPV